MRESIGGGLLFYIVIFFSITIILFFVGIISYSKAYRVKNRIVEIIEKYDKYDDVDTQITQSLKDAGYSLGSMSSLCNRKDVKEHLKKINNGKEAYNMNKTIYNYCVYKIDNRSYKDSYYYVVVTFVHFDVPLVGNVINIPVYGETKVLGKSYNY